ncbi:P-II family nitrogen regulator [Candidatus Nitrosotenuis cloacae]|jgi:nitrogen regulatory protein P-II 1|uniref:P-II family nitrogen regulator n=1 Tax=Candidatus Nitrosotenuis cloacae TaxID=1603555 RepID=UPI00227DCD5B|nr:P-II family nitrogen regulator [Candidatus Nitrosotenuis cloacae]
MKRLETIIPKNRLNLVISAIEDVGVGGITIIDSKGRGKGVRPSLRSSRGTSSRQAEYNNLVTIITIVDESQVDEVVDAVLDAANTGSNGDGKIFISTIDETVDIQTRRKGSGSL